VRDLAGRKICVGQQSGSLSHCILDVIPSGKLLRSCRSVPFEDSEVVQPNSSKQYVIVITHAGSYPEANVIKPGMMAKFVRGACLFSNSAPQERPIGERFVHFPIL
jgi:hypothetical protein